MIQGQQGGANKSMLDLLNGPAATRILRVQRVYCMNGYIGLAGLGLVEIARTISAEGGTLVTPVALDNGSTQLEQAVSSGQARKVTESALLRRFLYNGNEVNQGQSRLAEWEILLPFGEVWNAGYSDSNVQPVTLRERQGMHLKNTNSNLQSVDIAIEFTNEEA